MEKVEKVGTVLLDGFFLKVFPKKVSIFTSAYSALSCFREIINAVYI